MWQKDTSPKSSEGAEIYFEYDDQSTGAYNSTLECTVTMDGIHVVLTDGTLAHFYFPKDFDRLQELKEGLEEIYRETPDVLEVSV
jgi:hypothetical protein